MVPINKNPVPAELTRYIEDKKKVGLTPYFAGLTKGVKPAIQKSLCEEQGYICAYCMQRIEPDGLHMKIEHWDAQSNNKTNPEKTVDYSIMLGCCLGTEEGGVHCDTYRGQLNTTQQNLSLNPANPNHHSLLQIYYDFSGHIFSYDTIFNEEIGGLITQKKSRNVLNLNNSDLCNKRKKVLMGITTAFMTLKKSNITRDALLKKWTSKDSNGYLPEFFDYARWILENSDLKIK